MQKSNDRIVRKMPLPIDINIAEGTTVNDGIQTLTHKEASHIRILSIDNDNFLVYEISPQKKTTGRSLKDYIGEDQIIGKPETTIAASDGTPLAQYRYFKRPDNSYYVSIHGKASEEPHKIELGRLSDRGSPISAIAKVIAYKFDVKQFTRNDLKPLLARSMTHGQKLKALLEVLHREGFLNKEIDQTSRNKARELYAATDNLKKVVIPSPSPEQA